MKIFYSTDLPQSMERKCQEISLILREAITELEKAL